MLEDRRLLAFDVQFAPNQLNLDGIANFRNGAADLGDSVDASPSALLITDAFGASQSASGNGLPNIAFFPASATHPDVVLNYNNNSNGDNVVQLANGESLTITNVDGLNLRRMHLLSMTGGGATGVEVKLNYQDGGSTTLNTTVPNWLDTIVDGSTSGDATQYVLVDDMDRYDGAFVDSNDAAVFGHSFPVDPTRVLSSVVVTSAAPNPSSALLNVLGITFEEALDFGDLLSGNYPTTRAEDGARHIVTGPRLGATVTTELDARSIDLDDGVEFSANGTFSAGATSEIRVSLQNADPTSNRLDAWIDWNADGDFDEANERVLTNFDLGVIDADIVTSIPVPTIIATGNSVARFRLSTAGGLSAGGFAMDGEVEDYSVFLRSDGVHFSSLVGVDFDTAAASASPNNWNLITDFDPAGTTFTNLIAESGFTSPYSLQLSSTLAGIDSFPEPITNALPTHINDLAGLDGVISAPLVGSQAGGITAEWSGLRPFARYEIYVFGLEGALTQGDIRVLVNDAFPPISFSQLSTNSQLWVNAEVSDGASLGSHAVTGVANANGEISVSITQNSGSDALSLAGLAIEQLPYAGPTVIAASLVPGEIIRSVDGFRFTATIDTNAMPTIDADNIVLSGGGVTLAPESIQTVASGNTTIYTFEFGVIPDGNYSLRLKSGDGQFEDLLGADLDGNGDQIPGGDYLIGFSSESIVDYGDAGVGAHPISLEDNGARHIIGGPQLGALVDAEPNGLASATCCPFVSAVRDDLDNLDDEDGVAFAHKGELFTGTQAPIRIEVQNAPGMLNAWIDWNQDGDWLDLGEQIFDDEPVGIGTHSFDVPVPTDAELGITYVRFRIDSGGGLSSLGIANDGEVEDYQVVVREDPIQFSTLVGVDFDQVGGASPTNWNQISGFDRAGEAFPDLIGENGFASPFTLTLSSTTASSPSGFAGVIDPTNVPTHSQPLSGIDGIISTQTAEAGVVTAEWSGLRPGIPHDVYVFAVDGFSNDFDVTIVGASAPIMFNQVIAASDELWVNDEAGDNARSLKSFAISVVPDGDGKITITSNSSNLFNGFAALAIQQRHYSGPRVLFESVSHGSTAPLLPSNTFRYTVILDTGVMAPIDVNDIRLTGAASGDQPAQTVTTFPTAESTSYTFDFGNIPGDQYTVTLLSGDGQFEDAVGTNLDGERLGLALPSGDGIPGGDRVTQFTVENPWHNPVFPEDVNGDSFLNVTDLRQIFVYFSEFGGGDLDPAGPTSTGVFIDVNNSGTLSITDVRLVFVGVSAGLSGPGGEGEGQAAPLDRDDDEDEKWLAVWGASEKDWWLF